MKPISFICNVQVSITCLSGAGAGSAGSSSTSNSSPWSGQQPYLSNVFQDADQQYDSYTPQYFGTTNTDGSQIGESTITPFNQQETNSIQQIGNLGLNGNAALNSEGQNLTNYTNGSMLTGANNPGLQSVEQQAAASVTPSLMSAFTQGTNDNPNVALAASNGVANAVGTIANNNYQQQSQNQLAAFGDANNLYNTQLGGSQAALTAGQAQQTQDQNQLNNNVNMFNYYQQLPYTKLNQYANLVNGQYGQATTTSNTSPAGGFFSSLFS